MQNNLLLYWFSFLDTPERKKKLSSSCTLRLFSWKIFIIKIIKRTSNKNFKSFSLITRSNKHMHRKEKSF